MSDVKVILRNADSIGYLIEEATKAIYSNEVHVAIIKRHKKRSVDQNALLHMWVADIMKSFADRGITKFNCGTEMTLLSWKERLKGMFLATEDQVVWDAEEKRLKTICMPKNTRELSKSKMNALLNCIHQFAIEHDISIRIPEDCDWHQNRKEQGEAA